ncbi:hypothetical protein K501DRAFT_99899 [Backusella circina FSU 941]|nr:hypothetical protein K501DRAFT_99899 [Backusella circina FSU 941]
MHLYIDTSSITRYPHIPTNEKPFFFVCLFLAKRYLLLLTSLLLGFSWRRILASDGH